MYERGLSKINSSTNDVLNKQGLKLGIVIKTNKNMTVFGDTIEDPYNL
jgi:hypothetical protein